MDPHLNNFSPTQQQGTGLRRFLNLYVTARSAKWGLGTLLFLGVAQVAFKDELKPMNVAGQMVGSLWSAEQDAARRATVQTAGQMADAQAQAQARAQQQLLVQQMQQQYGFMTAVPNILFYWFLQGKCLLEVANNDPHAAMDCGAAEKFAAIINGQAGASMDSLGTTHAWPNTTPPVTAAPAPVPAVQDPPWTKAEGDRLFRLRLYASAQALEACEAGNPGDSAKAKRGQSACLAVIAGEGPDGPAPGKRRNADASAPRVIPPNSVLAR